MHAMRACARYPARPKVLSLCRSCPLVKWGGGKQVLSASGAVRESIVRWPALDGLGAAPLGALREAVNDLRVVLSIGVDVDRCAEMSAVLLRCVIADNTDGCGLSAPPERATRQCCCCRTHDIPLRPSDRLVGQVDED